MFTNYELLLEFLGEFLNLHLHRHTCIKSMVLMATVLVPLAELPVLWNSQRNSRVQVVLPRGPRLLPSAPLTLYMCVCVSVGLGSSLSKHVFDIQEMVVPVSNKDIVLLLLIVTRKFAVYFMLLNLTSIILFSLASHSESKEELSMLTDLSESWCSLLFSGSESVFPDVC